MEKFDNQKEEINEEETIRGILEGYRGNIDYLKDSKNENFLLAYMSRNIAERVIYKRYSEKNIKDGKMEEITSILSERLYSKLGQYLHDSGQSDREKLKIYKEVLNDVRRLDYTHASFVLGNREIMSDLASEDELYDGFEDIINTPDPEEIEQMYRKELRKRIFSALEGFPPRSDNKELAKIILNAVGIKGSSILFFTGGDESEPDGGVIKIPGHDELEISQIYQLVNWSEYSTDSYQRYSDDRYIKSPDYSLDESGEIK